MQDDAAERAYRFRDRLTENERDNAVGFYFQSGPGRDRAKAAAAYEALIQRGCKRMETTRAEQTQIAVEWCSACHTRAC